MGRIPVILKIGYSGFNSITLFICLIPMKIKKLQPFNKAQENFRKIFLFIPNSEIILLLSKNFGQVESVKKHPVVIPENKKFRTIAIIRKL